MKVETAKPQITIQEGSECRSSGWRIELGRLGESIAVEHLKQSGWQIIAINWRCGRFGEIDIIAREPSRMLVFCEVKTRLVTELEAGFHNHGFESVHWRKQRKITACAMNYIRSYRPFEKACRFDVIAIEYRLPADGGKKTANPQRSLKLLQSTEPVLTHVQGAFS